MIIAIIFATEGEGNSLSKCMYSAARHFPWEEAKEDLPSLALSTNPTAKWKEKWCNCFSLFQRKSSLTDYLLNNKLSIRVLKLKNIPLFYKKHDILIVKLSFLFNYCKLRNHSSSLLCLVLVETLFLFKKCHSLFSCCLF